MPLRHLRYPNRTRYIRVLTELFQYPIHPTLYRQKMKQFFSQKTEDEKRLQNKNHKIKSFLFSFSVINFLCVELKAT